LDSVRSSACTDSSSRSREIEAIETNAGDSQSADDAENMGNSQMILDELSGKVDLGIGCAESIYESRIELLLIGREGCLVLLLLFFQIILPADRKARSCQ